VIDNTTGRLGWTNPLDNAGGQSPSRRVDLLTKGLRRLPGYALEDAGEGAVVLVPDVEGNVGDGDLVVSKERLGRFYPASTNITSGRATVVASEAGRECGTGEAKMLPDGRYGKRRIEQELVDPCRRQPNRVRRLFADREVLSEGRQFVLNKGESLCHIHPTC
jgi:hypothetical protein